MTLPHSLVLNKYSQRANSRVDLPVSTLTMSFAQNPTVVLLGDNQELVRGPLIDVWLWMIAQVDAGHSLYRPFEDIMNPIYAGGWFYTEVDKAKILSDRNASGRVQWLWTKMHEPQLMDVLMQRFNSSTHISSTILDGVFPFVAMHHDASLLHNDPLWMAWWKSPHGAESLGGAKVLENLCLNGQASPVPPFITCDERPLKMIQFFENMHWDTIVARQIFSGVHVLAAHFNSDMPSLLQHKDLTPSIGQSLLDQPKRWDKMLSKWCANSTEMVGATTLKWFSHHLARDRFFLFFQETHQAQWAELQRRGLAPSLALVDLQTQLSHALNINLRTEEIPYEYRSERVLTAVAPLIEKAILMDALQTDTLPPKNAPSSRRKM